jgi:hypothetical protein
MNSCVVSGVIEEAEDWPISGYMHGPNKENGASRARQTVTAGLQNRLCLLSVLTTEQSVIVVGVRNCISPYVVRITVILMFINYCN